MNLESFARKEGLPMREAVELGYDGPNTVRVSNAQGAIYAVFEMRSDGLRLRRSEGANSNTIARWKTTAEQAFHQRGEAA